MKMKAISVVWLARTDLSNLNSGQGSGNLTELKTYDHGRKPYVSGQAVRRALFDTIARAYDNRFLCVAEKPCCDVANCWGCDLRGFLAPKSGEGSDRRWSPLKVAPALGQIPAEIVTDLLTRMSIFEKEDSSTKDNRIAHVQLMENIFRLALVLDLENIGRMLEPVKEENGKGKNKEEAFKGWQVTVDVGSAERKERIKAVLDGIYNLNGFAKQARAAASLAPEVALLTVQPVYNQRGLRALELNDKGEVDLKQLAWTLDEHKALGYQDFFGYTPGVVSNEAELLALLQQKEIEAQPVYAAFEQVKALVAAADL
ncbi:type I-B CRISPR-associated protein Cas7/Cst2/DevR [Carboxydocella sp. JDF658]|uniref:type I-B CRISPR-associated protein Cas7/Cst2/DevR n=1 Tax=Carboxydocella sp. JDF658 TaxID=1926600 RepID=UPI0009AD2DCC|nr:type I-B CRISPR-associated protein Cas7/Cst2/DevR [Carboxydocella sp. JDF658]GAW32205.1 hypothetical protein JDF658_19700 [Carboxydocella sp. JDF658]